MSFSLEEVTPKGNAWFSPNVGYEGTGRAEFADGRGAAEGDVRVLFQCCPNVEFEFPCKCM